MVLSFGAGVTHKCPQFSQCISSLYLDPVYAMLVAISQRFIVAPEWKPCCISFVWRIRNSRVEGSFTPGNMPYFPQPLAWIHSTPWLIRLLHCLLLEIESYTARVENKWTASAIPVVFLQHGGPPSSGMYRSQAGFSRAGFTSCISVHPAEAIA